MVWTSSRPGRSWAILVGLRAIRDPVLTAAPAAGPMRASWEARTPRCCSRDGWHARVVWKLTESGSRGVTAPLKNRAATSRVRFYVSDAMAICMESPWFPHLPNAILLSLCVGGVALESEEPEKRPHVPRVCSEPVRQPQLPAEMAWMSRTPPAGSFTELLKNRALISPEKWRQLAQFAHESVCKEGSSDSEGYLAVLARHAANGMLRQLGGQIPQTATSVRFCYRCGEEAVAIFARFSPKRYDQFLRDSGVKLTPLPSRDPPGTVAMDIGGGLAPWYRPSAITKGRYFTLRLGGPGGGQWRVDVYADDERETVYIDVVFPERVRPAFCHESGPLVGRIHNHWSCASTE